MQILQQQVLRTDAAGMPVEWIDYQEAVRLHYAGNVVYTLGTRLYRIRGGTNARSGRQSLVEIHSILATQGSHRALHSGFVPPLNNTTLFRRDGHVCLYCGHSFPGHELSRDHVTPLSQRGQDHWTNVVTACKRCNNLKAGRTPEQAGMQLLAVPFRPTYAEYMYLKGRRILADQMEFLRAHFPRSSPLRGRMT